MRGSQAGGWHLTVTVDEHLTAKQRADRKDKERLEREGLCVRCRKPRGGESKRCKRCTARAAEDAWRRRQGDTQRAHGPTPTRGVVGWNFGTDDLIADHIRMARSLAWRVARQLSSTSTEIDDMIGDALYGLVMAGRTYDQSYRVPFGAWATTQIKGAIYDGIRRWNHLGMKRPPRLVELGETEDGIRRFREDRV